MKDQTKTERTPLGTGQIVVQLQLDLNRVVFASESESPREPPDVRVDRQSRKAEHHAAHDV
ncbi:MAG: hypothetical protein RL391_859, partial [Actinomycetota bacterium]